MELLITGPIRSFQMTDGINQYRREQIINTFVATHI